MQISRKCEYAIHSLMILAIHSKVELSVEELAEMQGISRTYLAKVMQKLSKAGLVESSKGFKGGYQLTITPGQITLDQVVETFEREDNFYQCMKDERDCQLEPNCLIHASFRQAYGKMLQELKKVRISDLLLSMTNDKDKLKSG